MNDLHTDILDLFFWTYVDAGVAPEKTPLFLGMYDHQTLEVFIAWYFNITRDVAEHAISTARMEVAI